MLLSLGLEMMFCLPLGMHSSGNLSFLTILGISRNLKVLFFFFFFKTHFSLKTFLKFNFDCAGSLLLCGLFSSCSEWRLLFVVVLGLLTAVAFLLHSTGSRRTGSVVAALRL